MFLRSTAAPLYKIFKVEARAKKTQIFGQNFPKRAQTAFWPVGLKMRLRPKTRSFLCFGSAKKQFRQQTKKKEPIFLQIRTPLIEKILDPPLL